MYITIRFKYISFLNQLQCLRKLTTYKKRMPDFVMSNILSVRIIESIVIVNSYLFIFKKGHVLSS